jgi:hypothetical protein
MVEALKKQPYVLQRPQSFYMAGVRSLGSDPRDYTLSGRLGELVSARPSLARPCLLVWTLT